MIKQLPLLKKIISKWKAKVHRKAVGNTKLLPAVKEKGRADICDPGDIWQVIV